MIKAFNDLPENYNLEIYGDGPEFPKLLNLARNNTKIKLQGYISKEKELINAFINADLMVLPSIAEEMPLSILEALAAKVPVLCTSHPTVKSTFNGHLFYLDDPERELKEKIIQITTLNNKEHNKIFILFLQGIFGFIVYIILNYFFQKVIRSDLNDFIHKKGGNE